MITRHIKFILLLTGLGTLPAALLFFIPSLLATLLHVDVSGDAGQLFLRHWGLETGCVGSLLLYAAYQDKVRYAVLMAASVSKCGLVILLLGQLGNFALTGLAPVIVFDSTCVLLYATYLFQARPAVRS